ncbi:MAG TPA: DNA polymerase III subunit delta [Woeseiaceae bacterium]|nr:DNA polymerase III subunit delta [Woeseiaceae bacterium]
MSVKIAASQLTASLKKNLLPCYLVTGDEPLLAQEALDAVRAAARERGFTQREVHVAETGFDWRALGASAGNLSLFAERRLLELRLPTGKPGRDGSAAIVELVERLGDDLLLLVAAPRLDRQASAARWVEALGQRGAVVTVQPVELGALPAWIEARMRRAGLVPQADAVALVADRVEGNLLAADQEIEKLRLLLGEGPVTAADVERAVADSSRYDVFKLVDAALAGDAARALRILSGLRAEGVEPPPIAGALARELRVLAKLAHAAASRGDLGAVLRRERVWPSRERQLRAALARHSVRRLHDLVKLARAVDTAVRGRLDADPWQVATELVYGLAAGSRKAN